MVSSAACAVSAIAFGWRSWTVRDVYRVGTAQTAAHALSAVAQFGRVETADHIVTYASAAWVLAAVVLVVGCARSRIGGTDVRSRREISAIPLLFGAQAALGLALCGFAYASDHWLFGAARAARDTDQFAQADALASMGLAILAIALAACAVALRRAYRADDHT